MEQQTALSENATLEALAVLKAQQDKMAACSDLDRELASLQVEALEIEGQDQDLRERMSAAERMTRFEADRLVILGRASTPESTKLAALTEQLNSEAAMIERRKRVIAERCEAIIAEKGVVLRRAVEEFRDAAITLIRAQEFALASILDETRSHLNSLETRLGTSLYLPEQLTADERTNAWATLHLLYGGRRR